MKITKNDGGTVTVSVPKTDEQYDPTLGGLHYEETVSQADFDSLVKNAGKPAQDSLGTIEPPPDTREADEIARNEADLARHAADAATQQLARDRAQSQGANDQAIVSEKARLSAAATALNAETRRESELAAANPVATPAVPHPVKVVEVKPEVKPKVAAKPKAKATAADKKAADAKAAKAKSDAKDEAAASKPTGSFPFDR